MIDSLFASQIVALQQQIARLHAAANSLLYREVLLSVADDVITEASDADFSFLMCFQRVRNGFQWSLTLQLDVGTMK